MVPNLPNLGSLPILNDHNFPPIFPTSSFLRQLTIDHNRALRSALEQLKQNYPEIHVMYVDIYSITNILIQVLPLGSATGPAGDCLFINPANCTTLANGFKAPGYVFWDVEHPTTDIHKILAATMFIALHNTK